LAIALAFAGAAVLQGCGGDDAVIAQPEPNPPATPGTPAPPVNQSLIGTVATGLPATNVPVSILDASGASRSAVTDATGAFTADVTGLQAPFAASATLADGSRLVSVLPALAGGTGRINVTPLTNAIAARLAGGDPAALLAAGALAASATQGKVDAAVSELRGALSAQLTAAGLDPATFDPITTAFAADGTGADRLLDRVGVTVDSGGVTLADRFASPDAPAAVSLSGAVTSAPATLAAAVADGPSGTALDAFRRKMQACLDVPLPSRASVDAAGDVSAVHPTCAAVADASFQHNGYPFGRRYQQVLTEPEFDRAVVGPPSVLYVESGKAVIGYQIANNAGFPVQFAEFLDKKGADWAAVGNQRKYDAFVELRALRTIPVNAANATPGVDRLRLLLLFNPTGPGAQDVSTVRVKGPGLPAAGVVLTRSRTCGTAGFMAVVNKTGLVTTANGTSYISWVNNSSSPNFELAFANPTSPGYVWPNASVSYREAPMTDAEIAAQIPRYAKYTFEVFRPLLAGGTPSGVPDDTFEARLTGNPIGPGQLATLPWATLQQETIDSALKPTGTNASASPTVPMKWTIPPGGPAVFSLSGFTQNAIVPADTTGLSALRRTFNEAVPRGSTAGAISLDADDVKPGTAGAPFLAQSAEAQNPRCTPTLGALDATAATYRDLGTSQRLDGGLRMFTIHFWQNP
jgi:hypothetical protein